VGDWQRQAPTSRESAVALLRDFDPFFRLDGGAPASSAVVTNLQLTLFGIRLDEAMGRGSAIIATPDGVQKSYAVGDEIMPGIKLKEVAFDHVTIDRGGADEDLFIDQSGNVTPVNGSGTTSSAAALPPPPSLQAGGVTAADLRAGIGFIPRIDGGRVTGATVRSQGGSDVLGRIGLRPGDVITQINGRPITSTTDADALASSAGPGGSLSLSVERGTEILPLTVTVKGK
jgi:general secretion pathway protein C